MPPDTQRNHYVLASNILFAGLAISTVLWLLSKQFYPQPAVARPLSPWVLGGAGLLMLGWYYAIRLGQRWARVLLLVLFVASVALTLTYHPERVMHQLRTDWLFALSNGVNYASQVWALILLFRTPRPSTPVPQPR